jgi:hypothetical protein
MNERVLCVAPLESRFALTERKPSVEFLPFSKLTDVTIAPRVRNLLEGSYEILWREFASGLVRCLDDFERDLFKQAERAPNADQQSRLFAAMKEIKRKRGDVEVGARRMLQRSMLALIDPRLQDERRVDGHGSALSLIENTELEQSLAVSEIVARAEMRCSQTLFALCIRFAVIGGGAPVQFEVLPVGPLAVIRALVVGARELQLEPKQQVSLLQQFDRSAMARMGELLDSINRYLIESRVFPHLSVAVNRSRPAALASTGAAPVEPPAASNDDRLIEQVESAQAAHSAASTQFNTAPSTQASAPRGEPFEPAPPLPLAPADLALMAGAPEPVMQRSRVGPLSAFEQSARNDAAIHAQDLELFGTLRELLSGRRVSERGANPENQVNGPVLQATSDDLQSVLSVLQTQPSVPIMVGGRWVGRRISHIKQDTLNQLRGVSAGATPQISDEDSDTMDLVGMLFDHLLVDGKANSITQSLLTKLQVPLLKVALKDKSFFVRRNHPARQLLNAIAETAMFWVEDEDADRAVVEKMQMVVDRVCSEFDDDIGVFENLLGDMGRHAQNLQRKAEVSERRHIDAAKGRERLELARVRAVEDIEQRIRGRLLPEIVERVLGDAWADLLALTILRQGDDSAAYSAQLAVAEELIECFDGRYRPFAREHFETLRLAMGEGLALVGFHANEAERTLDGLVQALPAPMIGEAEHIEPVELPEPTPQMQEVTELVKEKTKATKDEKATILESLRKTERIPVTPKENAMIERIKQLPFGTWFDFQINQQGNSARRKLSWFSTVTGRCLFVNARGAKAEEKSLEQLARDLLRGNASVVEDVNEGVIEKGWKAIVGKLKSWTGIGQPTAANAETSH